MASAKLKLFEEVVDKTEAMVFQRSQGSDRKLMEASCCLCASSVSHRTGTWDTPPHFGGPVPDPGDRMEQGTCHGRLRTADQYRLLQMGGGIKTREQRRTRKTAMLFGILRNRTVLLSCRKTRHEYSLLSCSL